MKKFLIQVLFFGMFCLLVATLPSYFVDPYNVFHWKQIRNTGVEPNKNYIKTKYILANPEKFDGYLFGSSRVGAIHVEKIEDSRIYNMSYSGGTTHENMLTLETFIENGVDVKKVYVGVDSYSYTVDSQAHNDDRIRASYQYLSKNILNAGGLYIDNSLAMDGLLIMRMHNDIKGIDHFYDYGWWCDYNQQSDYNWDEAKPSLGNAFLLDETLNDIATIRDMCEQNDIDLVVFTNPMCMMTYEASVKEKNYAQFLKSLASITDYYNFSGLNSITIDTNNFLDSSHYNAEIGDLLIDTLVNHTIDSDLETQGFGFFVTEGNVGELLQVLHLE